MPGAFKVRGARCQVRRLGAWTVLALALLAPPRVAAQNRVVLEAELERLQTALRIPAMSAAVVDGGTIV